MTNVLRRRRGENTQRIPCDEGGRDWSNLSTSQGMPSMVSQKDAKRKEWSSWSPESAERAGP